MDDDRYSETFRFGPLERRGLVGTLSPGQLIIIATGCVAALIVFRTAPTAIGFLAGVALVVVAAATALVPLGGRTVEQWTPLAVDWIALRLRGENKFRSGDPFGVRGELPGCISKCRVIPYVLGDGRELGVIHDGALHAYCGAVFVRMRALGLLAAAEQERRLAAWGRVLASLASDRGAIRRVQLLERTVPSDPDELISYLEEQGTRQQRAAYEQYVELLQSAAQVAQDHELLIVVQVDEKRAWRSAAADAGSRRLDRDGQACAVVGRELDALAQRLEASELSVFGVLDAAQLTAAVKLGFDPYNGSPSGSSFSPTAADTSWSTYRCDRAIHRTYWVAEWPRTGVGPAFFTPLLLGLQAVRAVSVVLEPVAPGRARAAVEAAITSDEADEQVRTERGFRTTARRGRQADAARRREQELADGHEEMRFAGFITVSGRDDDDLRAACAELEHAAQRAFLVLEPLWGQQDLGLTFSALPLARGLRSARPWSVAG
jgi:hypothetical protein